MSAFGHWDELEPLKIWDGVIGRAVAGREATLAAIELDPDTTVPEHQHVNEQTGMLVRGSLTFRNAFSRASAKAGGDDTFAPLPPFAFGAFPQPAEVVLQAFEGAFHRVVRIIEDGRLEQMSRSSCLVSADENHPDHHVWFQPTRITRQCFGP